MRACFILCLAFLVHVAAVIPPMCTTCSSRVQTVTFIPTIVTSTHQQVEPFNSVENRMNKWLDSYRDNGVECWYGYHTEQAVFSDDNPTANSTMIGSGSHDGGDNQIFDLRLGRMWMVKVCGENIVLPPSSASDDVPLISNATAIYSHFTRSFTVVLIIVSFGFLYWANII